jgi:hypothetical protein
MKRLALFGLCVIAALAPSLARADLLTFYIKNTHTFAVALEFFSHDRNEVWPGNDQVYLLDSDERKSIPIECNAGENICYGAWANGNDRLWWGVGPDNDHPCENCCRICKSGVTETINLSK